jgi:3-oxoadipate enol-lactonase
VQTLDRPFGALHVAIAGPEAGPAVIFADSLGTDLRLWDALLPLLPPGLRLLRFDKRGHGLSDAGAPFSIEDLADDAIALVEAAAKGPVVFVGLSVGGLIAQAVAARRPDLLRGLVLSNTAAKIGTTEMWDARIAAIRSGGLASIADPIMERWFAPSFRATPALAPWRNMMARTDEASYVATCQAIEAADYRAAAAKLRMPTLVIGGEHDGSTPPAVVTETAGLIPGAALEIIPGAAHLPCVERPEAYAVILTAFLKRVGHA